MATNVKYWLIDWLINWKPNRQQQIWKKIIDLLIDKNEREQQIIDWLIENNKWNFDWLIDNKFIHSFF